LDENTNQQIKKALSKVNLASNNWFIITTPCPAKQNKNLRVHVTKLTKANHRVLMITLVETRTRKAKWHWLNGLFVSLLFVLASYCCFEF